MKILAVNSSSRRENQSVTEMMLTRFVKGMSDAGAEVEQINLRKKKIRNCKGCYSCQTESPGICVMKDEMTDDIFPKLMASDIVVYATPLFHHLMNAPMKRFIERTFPICTTTFRQSKNGRWGNLLRAKYPAAVILSVGGYLDENAFNCLSYYANYLWGKSLLAELYRPAAEFMAVTGPIQDDILNATEQAGRELVENGKVSEETINRIKQPFGTPEEILRLHNMYWEQRAISHKTPGKSSKEDAILKT